MAAPTSCTGGIDCVGCLAKGYSHHHEGDGHREDWCEQPARLTNTLLHGLAPSELAADNDRKERPFQAGALVKTIAFCDRT